MTGNSATSGGASVAAAAAVPDAAALDARSTSRRRPRLIAYPRGGIDYCDQLYRAVAELGTDTVEGQWAGRWIIANVRREDLVHIHWPSFLYFHARAPFKSVLYLLRFFVLIGIVRMLGGRIAWTAHNLYPHDGGRNSGIHRLARQFITRVAESVFVHGPTAARLVSAEFGVAPEHIRQVPHGHWRSRYPHLPDRREARQRTGLPQEVMLYGFIGSCRPYKNLESIVMAFPHVDSSSHLVIAGASSPPGYLDTIRAMTAESCQQRVHIVPRFLADEEIMTYVAALDALVLSYKEILTSGAVMLAFSAGVPVVAPRMGCLQDIVDERCGVLYDPKAPHGLAEAMREIGRRSYAREAIIAHALSYDWRVSAGSLIELLDRRSVRA